MRCAASELLCGFLRPREGENRAQVSESGLLIPVVTTLRVWERVGGERPNGGRQNSAVWDGGDGAG